MKKIHYDHKFSDYPKLRQLLLLYGEARACLSYELASKNYLNHPTYSPYDKLEVYERCHSDLIKTTN